MYNLYKFKPENVPDVKPDDYKRFMSSSDHILAIINPTISEKVRKHKNGEVTNHTRRQAQCQCRDRILVYGRAGETEPGDDS